MIPIEAINNVKHIITHAHCPDGVASAILLKDILPDAALAFMGYQSRELKALPAGPNMLFCDIVPPEDRAQEFIDAGAIVLDHHKGVKDLIGRFGERGVFADEFDDPGVSGAVLAFEHVWKPLYANSSGEPCSEEFKAEENAKWFALLVGIRDTWQRHHPTWTAACNLSAALQFMPWNHWELKEPRFNDAKEWRNAIKLGMGIRERHLDRVNHVVKQARFFESAQKTKVWTMPGGFHNEFATDAADVLGDQADLVVTFDHQWDGHQDLQLSLRSRGAFDCKAFCKEYGGGGHTNAAGCTVRDVGGGPYRYIQDAIEAFEASQSHPVSSRFVSG